MMTETIIDIACCVRSYKQWEQEGIRQSGWSARLASLLGTKLCQDLVGDVIRCLGGC